jgi:hypothetical protein
LSYKKRRSEGKRKEIREIKEGCNDEQCWKKNWGEGAPE